MECMKFVLVNLHFAGGQRFLCVSRLASLCYRKRLMGVMVMFAIAATFIDAIVPLKLNLGGSVK